METSDQDESCDPDDIPTLGMENGDAFSEGVLDQAALDLSALKKSILGKGLSPCKGLKIGKFTLIDCLGKGSYGEVWRASEESLRRELCDRSI